MLPKPTKNPADLNKSAGLSNFYFQTRNTGGKADAAWTLRSCALQFKPHRVTNESSIDNKLSTAELAKR